MGEATDDRNDALADEIHARCLVLDAHADVPLPTTGKQYLARDGGSKVSADRLQAGGVDAVVLSAAVEPGRRNEEGYAKARAIAEEKVVAIRRLVDEDPDRLALAQTADEILDAKKSGRSAIVLGFQNAYSLGEDPAGIDAFYAAGARVFGLNHIGHNAFSDSSRPNYRGPKRGYEPTEEHGGLSPLGVDAIRRVNRLGGVVDVSQLSKRATLQTIDLSTTPVIASHSNVRAISDATRNLSDEEIDAIGASGGVVHVTSFSPYLVDLREPGLLDRIRATRREHDLPEYFSYPFELYWEIRDPERKQAFLASMRGLIRDLGLDDMVDHVDYLVDRIGVDHVGVGNDFNHGTNVKGFEDASEAGNLTRALARRGYVEDDIDRIWGHNALRVMRAAEAGAA